MRAKGMKSLTFILPQEAKKPFVAPAATAGLSGTAPAITPLQGRMSDREVDQQLVERAQRGAKRAFEMLVLKYQRKLERLLSRVIRDPAEIEDVAQEAFIKAYRALPNFRGDSAFYTWLYRIAVNKTINFLKQRRARNHLSLNDLDLNAEHDPDLVALVSDKTPRREVGLKGLSPSKASLRT